MKYVTKALCCVVYALSLMAASVSVQAEIIKTRIGDLSFTHDFENGYPTDATQKLLFNEIDFQRACQAYLWSIPIVSMAQSGVADSLPGLVANQDLKALFSGS